MNPLLSIVTGVLNDNEEINLTIKSIRQTAPTADVEIVVVDDASKTPVILEDKKAILIRNEVRRGAGAARHQAAEIATGQYLLLTDCHMRFTPSWFDNAMKVINGHYTTMFCACCLGLDERNMDVSRPYGKYFGANLVLYEPEQHRVFEGVWRPEEKGQDNYELSCVMGACYFIPREYFLFLRGFKALRMWGTEEPYLSMKVWLSGGSIRMMKSVQIGHKFRHVAPYSTELENLTYNKLWAVNTLVDPPTRDFLMEKLSTHRHFNKALVMLTENEAELKEYQQYYKSIFKYDTDWFIKKFTLPGFKPITTDIKQQKTFPSQSKLTTPPRLKNPSDLVTLSIITPPTQKPVRVVQKEIKAVY